MTGVFSATLSSLNCEVTSGPTPTIVAAELKVPVAPVLPVTPVAPVAPVIPVIPWVPIVSSSALVSCSH